MVLRGKEGRVHCRSVFRSAGGRISRTPCTEQRFLSGTEDRGRLLHVHTSLVCPELGKEAKGKRMTTF